MKRCIINLVTAIPKYAIGQRRLVESLRENFTTGEVFAYRNENEVNSPRHTSVPYAFKVHAFQKAFTDGYESVIWLDASVVATAPVEPLFEELEATGYFMQKVGHLLGRWTNQHCLDHFGLTREDIERWPMYGDAGLLGLTSKSPKADQFLSRWAEAAEAGAFNGDWSNHRHDMTCGSVLAGLLHMKMAEPNKYLSYGWECKGKGEHTCLLAVGV
jgi:hypothetical protein